MRDGSRNTDQRVVKSDTTPSRRASRETIFTSTIGRWSLSLISTESLHSTRCGALTSPRIPWLKTSPKIEQVSYVRSSMRDNYNSAQGQFLSEDPVFLGDPKQQNLKDPQSLNSYSFANDNPITNEDPSGRFVPQAVALGFLLGGVSGVAFQGIADYQSGQFSGLQAYGVAFGKGGVTAAAAVVNPFLGAGAAGGFSLLDSYAKNGALTSQDAVNAVAEGTVTGLTAGYLKGLPQVSGVQATDILGSTYYTGAHAQRYAGEALLDFSTGLYYSGIKGAANTVINSPLNTQRNTAVMSTMSASTPAYMTQTYTTPNGKSIDWFGNILSAPANSNKKR